MENENHWHNANENWAAAISATQCDSMLKSNYVPTDKYDPYACNTSDLAYGYTLKILDLNIPTSDSHKFWNTLERFCNRGPNGEGFITDGRGRWVSKTALYNNTNHTDSYRQFAFHKLASIKFFYENPNDAMISIVLNKFIASLRD